MSRARLLTGILPDSARDLMKGERLLADANAPQKAQDLLNLKYLRDKFGVDIQERLDTLRNSQGLLGNNGLVDAAILGGGSLALVGAGDLGEADGSKAINSALLGAGITAAPAIFNEVRDPRFRIRRPSSKNLVGMIAAGAGAGAGGSMLLDALGL